MGRSDFNGKLATFLPSVLWHCWLDIRKSIRPVKNWVMRCWRGYISGVTCKWFACGPADATATLSSLASLKSRLVWTSWCRLTQVVLEKRPLNGCLDGNIYATDSVRFIKFTVWHNEFSTALPCATFQHLDWLVSWSLTSLFSTNMAISETKTTFELTYFTVALGMQHLRIVTMLHMRR